MNSIYMDLVGNIMGREGSLDPVFAIKGEREKSEKYGDGHA